MIWLAIFALTLVALFALVQPFFRSHAQSPALDDQDYLAAQLKDIERDRAAGLLSEDDAAAAALEARRRLLDQVRASQTAPAAASSAAQTMKMASVMLIGAAPVAAVAIYMTLGNPTLAPAGPKNARAAAASMPPGADGAADAASVAQSIERLAQRLKDNPDDLDGWIMLGQSYVSTDRFDEAVDAFTRAVALAPERAFLYAAQGEAIVMANGGAVEEEALAAFDRALERDQGEPRARFYKALALYQGGERDAALDALVALANDAPPGAQWLDIVGREIAEVAGELNRPLDALALTPAARGALGGEQTPEALESRIAAGGAPYTDWLALIDAYAAAGDAEKAADALARARQRYAGAPFVQQELNAAAAKLGLEAGSGAAPRRGPTQQQMQAAATMSDQDRQSMIEGMVAGLAARLENEPDDLEGWMMLGRSYGVLGRPADSVAAFKRAVDLAPDNPDVRVAYAKALLSQRGGEDAAVDAQALEALKAIERLNPDEPFALYFLGVAAQQDGDKKTARDYWEKLLAQLPKGTPDAANVQAMIDGL